MRTPQKCDTIIPMKGGFACCPRCKRKLVKINARTRAVQLAIYCRHCSEYFTIDIQSGQCFLSPCPITPDGE